MKYQANILSLVVEAVASSVVADGRNGNSTICQRSTEEVAIGNCSAAGCRLKKCHQCQQCHHHHSLKHHWRAGVVDERWKLLIKSLVLNNKSGICWLIDGSNDVQNQIKSLKRSPNAKKTMQYFIFAQLRLTIFRLLDSSGPVTLSKFGNISANLA